MKYKISIPEPCHEDWNKMTPNEKGRFCDSCEKTIFDFSNYSKTELAKRVNSGEAMCGRFKRGQLNTPLNYQGPLYLKGANWMLSLAGLLAVASTAIAQPSSEVSFSLTELVEREYKNLDPNKDTILLKATVYDAQTNAALSNVQIQVKEYAKIATTTDEFGRFQLAVPNKLERITLVFQNEFVIEKEIKVDLQQRDLKPKVYLVSIPKELEAKAEESVAVNNDTRIKSTVIDEVTNESIPFANIRVFVDGELAAGAQTDFDGNFEMDIPPYIRRFKMKVTNSSYEEREFDIDLDQNKVPDKIRMSIDEEDLLVMGIVISNPVDQTNQYLGEQLRKYYR